MHVDLRIAGIDDGVRTMLLDDDAHLHVVSLVCVHIIGELVQNAGLRCDRADGETNPSMKKKTHYLNRVCQISCTVCACVLARAQ